MTATPALAAWRRRGDTATIGGLWRSACWAASAADLHRQGCLERAAWCAGVSRVIGIDANYCPGDENDRILPDGRRVPGPMERRALCGKAQFRALMRQAPERSSEDAVLAEVDREWAERLAQLRRTQSRPPVDWPRARRGAWV